MSVHERFHYRSLGELTAELSRLGLELPWTENLEVLRTPVVFGRCVLPNRLACQPMEGCDGESNGAPSRLTLRRYQRFGAGGAGLWVGVVRSVMGAPSSCP